MKNNKKAFTLIELLAVIIILAIIALIAVPVVMNIITKARKSAFKDSAYGVIKAGELYYTEKLLEPNGMEEDVTFEFPNSAEELPLKGQKPDGGQIKITRNGNIAIALLYGNNCIRKGLTETEVTVEEDVTEENCSLGEDVLSEPAAPELKIGMIPVNIAPNGTVTKADITGVWYNYANKEWANAVTVTESSRANYMNATAGTTIQEADILTYLVWIPRYKYELWNVDGENPSKPTPHSIAITFENKDTAKSTGSTNGTYLTHPAFTFGNEELNGFWVGKFETGYKGAQDKYEAQQNINNSDKAVIKPNVYSWTKINVNNAFYTVKGMNAENNVFGLNNTSDTHMTKNTEWGAVAYLSHSIYGKDGEVYIMNDWIYKTGCGETIANANGPSTCDNAYGSKSDNVYNQSTTGNVSGVFDMSGGAHEYVMGYTTGASTQYGSSGFTVSTFPASKYVDTYSSTSNTQYTNRILGDATGEMGPFSEIDGEWYESWYQGRANFIDSSEPWFLRSGFSGMFSFFNNSGKDDKEFSFRITIA